MNWRKYLKLIAGLVVLSGALYFAARVHRHLYSTIPNAYAVWSVSDMVAEYMETHEGRWPKCWDDLRQPYRTLAKRGGAGWTFEELQDRVSVDWDADPAKLIEAKATDGEPPFRVIWLSDGSQAHWDRREPNKMILDYLHWKAKQKN